MSPDPWQAGFLYLRPKWEEYQLTQEYHELSFEPFGFFPPGDRPAIHESPLRVSERWLSNNDLVGQPDFVERALDSLYTWSRNHGSTTPREDFAECFAESCNIGWVYGGSHEIAISVFSDFSVELVPSWDLTFTLQPR